MWWRKRTQQHPIIAQYLEKMHRRKKMYHLPIEHVRFVSIDTETTGVDVKRDKILTFSAVGIYQNEIRLDDIFSCVLPQQWDEEDKKSIPIHWLRPNDTLQEENTPELLLHILAYLQDAVLVGINIAFDFTLLSQRFEKYWNIPLRNPTIDITTLAIRLEYFGFPSAAIPYHTITATHLAERFGLPLADRHTSHGDAILAAQLFIIFVSKLRKRGVTKLKQLLKKF